MSIVFFILAQVPFGIASVRDIGPQYVRLNCNVVERGVEKPFLLKAEIEYPSGPNNGAISKISVFLGRKNFATGRELPNDRSIARYIQSVRVGKGPSSNLYRFEMDWGFRSKSASVTVLSGPKEGLTGPSANANGAFGPTYEILAAGVCDLVVTGGNEK
jgi:hypothetical protein